MNIKDVLVKDLSFSTQNKGPLHSLLNAGKAALYIPIVGMIMGIVLITISSLNEKHLQRQWIIFGQGEHRLPRIILLSLCAAGLGLLLLPLAIAGTIIKIKERNRQFGLPIQQLQNAPSTTARTVREVPPDYLL